MNMILREFRDDNSGATGIEYGIIAAFIAITIIAGIQFAGTETAQSFSNTAEGLRNAAP